VTFSSGFAGLAAPGPGLVPTRVTPSLQRLLDRLCGVPLVVYDAAWNLVVANAPYDALMGETSALTGNDRNGVWRHVVGQGSRAVQTSQEHAEQVSRLVADLRLTAPDPAPADQSRHKVIQHPDLGPINLECDTLVVAGADLRIMAYTAEPNTEDAQRLELAILLGTQTLVE